MDCKARNACASLRNSARGVVTPPIRWNSHCLNLSSEHTHGASGSGAPGLALETLVAPENRVPMDELNAVALALEPST